MGCMPPHRSHPICLFVLANLALACVGNIGGAGGSPSGASAPIPPADGTSPGGSKPPSSSPGAPSAADPGRIAIRRLNRTEYNNTVRDLLGTSLRPADDFGGDPSALGFDNNGDVQSLTPSQVEQYESAAFTLVDEAFADGSGRGVERIAQAGRTSACEVTAEDCRFKLVQAFARQAWRRPPREDELERVMGIAQNPAISGMRDPVAQLRLVLVGILASPHFLFRVEVDPDPRSPAARPLGDHQLAARLSYLFWSSLPDDALSGAADQGRLRSQADLRAQIARMLADEKAGAFVESFAGQWLDLRELDSHLVDPALFPEFTPSLARQMQAETLRFFGDLLNDRKPARPVQALLAENGGILTHRSVLTATSAPNGTNPVARGNWVLTKLLCAPPPPPPPNVPPAPEGTATGTTMRARFEAHRADPVCASCHQVMDPIGFALEHYDAIGRYRTSDNGAPVDARGELPDGTRFDGAVELAAVIARDRRFSECLASHLFTYAVGRAPADSVADQGHLRRLTSEAANAPGGLTLHNLLLALGTSDVVRLRRGESDDLAAGDQGGRL
jgi:hypothetical protein